jgi:hypothetical protein
MTVTNPTNSLIIYLTGTTDLPRAFLVSTHELASVTYPRSFPKTLFFY